MLTPKSVTNPEASFWMANRDNLTRVLGVCILSGFLVSISMALLGYVSRKFETSTQQILLGGTAIGLFLSALILSGSWYTFWKIRRMLLRISIEENDGFKDVRQLLVDNGSKWDLREDTIVGTYFEIPFRINYFSFYNQNDDQRGFVIRIGVNLNSNGDARSRKSTYGWNLRTVSDSESVAFIPYKEIMAANKIRLGEFLEAITGR